MIHGFRLFDSSIGIVLTFEFGHDITIMKMAIFDKVDFIDIEPALLLSDLYTYCIFQNLMIKYFKLCDGQ